MIRDFKGIWIPREIWLRKDISALEKSLWAEINSLFDPENGGCYASNEYLADFCGVQDRRLREMISKLKSKGLVEQVSFNGRVRVIKAIVPNEDFGMRQLDRQKSASQTGRKVPVSVAEKCHPHIYRDTSIDTSIDNTPPTPSRGLAATAASSATADGVGAGKGSKTKPKKAEISEKAKSLLPKFLSIIAEVHPDYRPPKDKSGMLQEIDKMLQEGIDEDSMFKALSFAIRDNTIRGDWNGWASKVLCANPARYLRLKFNQILTGSKAKKERGFAPSSDDNKALEAFAELRKNAL
jgi:hypothetical protein